MSQGFGAFGKIPALGDFMRMNIAHGFVQVWDDWLQAAITELRAAIGEGWDDAYLTAPIWRFTLPEGLAGPTGMIGILMASVDRVGRQFPLTLAAPTQIENTAQTHFANTRVFEGLEQIALSMLDDGSDREMLSAALEQMGVAAPQGALMLPYAGRTPPEHILAGEALSRSVGPQHSIWSTVLQDENRLMTTSALPQGHTLRALFDASQPARDHHTTEFP